jgi:hypothetical protein
MTKKVTNFAPIDQFRSKKKGNVKQKQENNKILGLKKQVAGISSIKKKEEKGK